MWQAWREARLASFEMPAKFGNFLILGHADPLCLFEAGGHVVIRNPAEVAAALEERAQEIESTTRKLTRDKKIKPQRRRPGLFTDTQGMRALARMLRRVDPKLDGVVISDREANANALAITIARAQLAQADTPGRGALERPAKTPLGSYARAVFTAMLQGIPHRVFALRAIKVLMESRDLYIRLHYQPLLVGEGDEVGPEDLLEAHRAYNEFAEQLDNDIFDQVVTALMTRRATVPREGAAQ
jgi:hypothetical protein